MMNKLDKKLDLTNTILKQLYNVTEESVKTAKLLKSKVEVLNYFITYEPDSVESIIFYTNEIDELFKQNESNIKLIDALSNVLKSI